MSQRYLGGIITANPTAPTMSSASGVWTLEQQLQYSQSITPKVITRSVRLRSSASAYMARTPTSVTSGRAWTWSAWVKRGVLGNSGLFDGYVSTTNFTTLAFSNNSLLFYSYVSSVEKANMVTPAVFRDSSAWYHIVLVYDSANATSADRLIIYVNGVRQTLTTTTAVTQNDVTYINNTSASQRLGIRSDVPYYFDGEIAETNFVDGQVLTPSSFGAYDSNGVWQPLGYTGTYGANGVYLPFNINTTSTYGGSFNGSNQYIGITANAAFSFTTGAFTAECWFNSTTVSANQELIDFWPAASGSYTVGQWQFGTNTSGNLVWSVATSTISAGNITLTGTTPYLANTWNHAAVVRNGTTVTLYLNGVSVGSTTFSGTIGAATVAGSLGRQTTGSLYLSGYISNVRVTNTAVYTSAFTPSTSALTAVSGTQLLTLQNATLIDNSTNAFSLTNGNTVTFGVQYPFTANIAADASGNGNNWSPFNISLVNGTTYDSMLDSPTNFDNGGTGVGNYAVLNPIGVPFANGTVTNGNLKFAGLTTTDKGVAATISIYSGTFYWETTQLTNSGSSNCYTGVILTGASSDVNANRVYVRGDGVVYKYGTSLGAVFPTFTNNDVIGLAYDRANNTLALYKNGTLGYTVTGLNSADHTPWVGGYTTTDTWAVNFGQIPFSYTPPTGFKALNTQNLALAAPPTITNGAKYMAATLYTGNGATQSIANSANNTIGTTFQPDLVWIKNRGAIASHSLLDVIRGTNSYLYSDLTNAQGSGESFSAFNANGFSLSGTNARQNANANTYVAWQWKASGTTSSNTNGSITSTISVGTTQGFSVVTYTGTGANATVGHGLGVAPSMIIIKNRSQVSAWIVGHQNMAASTPWAGYMVLNTTAAYTTASGSLIWNSTAPTSTVFSVGTDTATNFSGNSLVAYCFAAVAGYSAFGSYTGNGSADGPFIYTGFRPRFVMMKASSAAGDWIMLDTSRDSENVMDARLQANASDAESTTTFIDSVSNGFKVRSTNANVNASSVTITYAAFAENPFTIARAR